jgi:hypothetical protein
MNSTANSHSSSFGPTRWQSLLAGLLLVTAFVYFWILPIFRPRGDFLWGHYQLQDIYFGIPVALTTICALLVLAVPIRTRHKLAVQLAMVVVSVLLTFIVCDIGYAFGFKGALHPNFWLDRVHISRKYSGADSELGFVRKPFVKWRGYVPEVDRIVDYRTDQNGFRNAPGEQHADIVFLGDSYTEAASVGEEDTFVRRVSKATGLSSVNLGRGAYGPQQELIVLRRYGLLYKPRFVVWQLFEGNDLTDAEEFAEWQKNPNEVDSTLKDRYFDNSLLNEILANTRSPDLRGPRVTLRYQDGTTRRVILRYKYEPEQPSTRRVGISETLNAIEAGYKLCQQQGSQLLVVFVPTMVRAMAPNISFDRSEDQTTFLGARRPAQKDFSSTIEEFCTSVGCIFVDSVVAMQEASAKGKRNLYIPNDEHFDVDAHIVMADLIVDLIQSKKP